MKLAFNSSQCNFVSIAKNLCVGIFLDVSFAYIFPISNSSQSQKNIDDDKKPAKKEKGFKNQIAVRIFPDAIKKMMHVVARSGNKKDIDFLVFDINGNMVLNYKMKAGERKTISDLKKGSYMYHVFAEDEYLMTGKIVFR